MTGDIKNNQKIKGDKSVLEFINSNTEFISIDLDKETILIISINEIDEDFFYAKDSLLHYTDWMLENELPYLDKANLLEFPNHTWVAQDIRKAYIFSIASKLYFILHFLINWK